MRSTDYVTAKGRADRLMSQAHAKNGDLPGEVPDQIDADAGILRSARTRGEYDSLRLHGLDIGDLELVVAANLNLGAEFPEILNQVVGKRIVVVENEDHGISVLLAVYTGRQGQLSTQKPPSNQAIVPTDVP
jgi:hypothetical protein